MSVNRLKLVQHFHKILWKSGASSVERALGILKKTKIQDIE